jgi:hypothetical protein
VSPLFRFGHQHVHALAHQGVHGVIENGGCDVVALHDVALRIRHHNGFGHRFENAAQLDLTQTQMPFHLFSFGDLLTELLDGNFSLSRLFTRCHQSGTDAFDGKPNQQ